MPAVGVGEACAPSQSVLLDDGGEEGGEDPPPAGQGATALVRQFRTCR